MTSMANNTSITMRPSAPSCRHNHPAVNRRVAQALESVDLVGVGNHRSRGRTGGETLRHVPSAERVLLCNSGSEATYNAIRLARAGDRTNPPDLKFSGCYHGWHDYCA